ncbi:unnamed protein product [Ilex paraguariensis]|uniref:Uncharacterized protein n=1 Tax=Ilex paraguariensis TaxID=185542 RepID=A0ABC8R145_9AQUA
MKILPFGQHEVLASGPIEDLIAHREHRYRISGSSLLAAMDQSSLVPAADLGSAHLGDREQIDGSLENQSSLEPSHLQGNGEKLSRVEDRGGRGHPTVDIAEVLRRWTHALQRVHKQSLLLAKANDGEGPELLRIPHDGGTSGHAESLVATLAEHRQHLASIQVLINQLKEAAPSIKTSISELTEEVNNISSNFQSVTKHHGRSASPIEAQCSGRTLESSIDEVADVTSRLSTVQLEKVSASPQALKLPQLFSLTPNSSGKGSNLQKRQLQAQTNQIENISERKSMDQPLSSNHMDNPPQDGDNFFVQNLKRSVREAALSVQSFNLESSQDSRSDDGSEHFFVPLSGTELSRLGPENKLNPRSKQLFASQTKSSLLETHAPDRHFGRKYDGLPNMLSGLDSLHDYDRAKGFFAVNGSNYAVPDAQSSFYDTEEAQDQVFSPPLLMDTSLLGDSYEDLLAPLSETETFLMEH